MKYLLWPMMFILITGCVSHGNLFQDGKTVGRKQGRSSFSLSLNNTGKFEADTVRNRVDVKGYHYLAPWAQLQVDYGVTDHFDVGGTFGIGLLAIGAQAFVKYSFLPRDSNLGIAAFASGGLSGSNDQSVEKGSIGYINYFVALPISYDLSEKSQIIIQPILNHDRFKYKIEGDMQTYQNVYAADILKLGIGYAHIHGGDMKVHYNVTLNYWQAGEKYWPSFGIAFSKP